MSLHGENEWNAESVGRQAVEEGPAEGVEGPRAGVGTPMPPRKQLSKRRQVTVAVGGRFEFVHVCGGAGVFRGMWSVGDVV